MKFRINYSIRGVATLCPLYHIVEASSAEEMATIPDDVIKEQIMESTFLARIQGSDGITLYRDEPKVNFLYYVLLDTNTNEIQISSEKIAGSNIKTLFQSTGTNADMSLVKNGYLALRECEMFCHGYIRGNANKTEVKKV
jgi:hypothetical protein